MDALTREAEIETRPRTRRRWPMLLASLAVLAAIGATIWLWPKSATHTAMRNRNANQPVPILYIAATQKDVPIYLDGLGTVQAFNTVTIKPMVDGPLTAVNFKEGQEVHKGDVLAQIDPRTYKAALDQAVAKKDADQALLANARLDLARYEKLVANKYTSAQQADTAKAQVAQYAAQVEQDQAAVDAARTNLGYTTIAAPIDGRTGIRQVDVGNIVHASDSTGLVVITQLQPISVLFTLPQQSLQSVLAAQQQGTPTVLAYQQAANGGAGALLDTGMLSVLDNQVDPTTGTIKLKATFPNPGDKLWPGAFVGVKLQVRVARDAVVVPPAAVQRGPNGAYVWLVTAQQTAQRQPVTVGHEDEQESIVTVGLKPGQMVVVDGASRLQDGSKVTVVQPAAAGAAPGSEQPRAPGAGHRRGGAG